MDKKTKNRLLSFTLECLYKYQVKTLVEADNKANAIILIKDLLFEKVEIPTEQIKLL